jgi:hypothetical protein
VKVILFNLLMQEGGKDKQSNGKSKQSNGKDFIPS